MRHDLGTIIYYVRNFLFALEITEQVVKYKAA